MLLLLPAMHLQHPRQRDDLAEQTLTEVSADSVDVAASEWRTETMPLPDESKGFGICSCSEVKPGLAQLSSARGSIVGSIEGSRDESGRVLDGLVWSGGLEGGVDHELYVDDQFDHLETKSYPSLAGGARSAVEKLERWRQS